MARKVRHTRASTAARSFSDNIAKMMRQMSVGNIVAMSGVFMESSSLQ
jgi:hypothetical protein